MYIKQQNKLGLETISQFNFFFNKDVSDVIFIWQFQGRVVALDKTTMKVEKIAANVKRWNLTCVECHVYDSTKAVSSKSGMYVLQSFVTCSSFTYSQLSEKSHIIDFHMPTHVI